MNVFSWLKGAGVLALAGVLGVGICGCGNSERRAVEDLLSVLSRAVEAGDRQAFLAGISDDYADGYGYDRLGMSDRVFEVADAIDPLQVELEGLEIEVSADGQTATARFRAHLSGKGAPERWEVEALRQERYVLVVAQQYNRRFRIRSAQLRRVAWGEEDLKRLLGEKQ